MKQESKKAWYDPHTDSTGFGKAYGENTFNNRPVHAVEVDLKELQRDFNPKNIQRTAMKKARERVLRNK